MNPPESKASQTNPKADKSVSISLGRKTVSRLHNQAVLRGRKARLSALTNAGKLDEAKAYALAHGLTCGGEGVAPGVKQENANHSIPTSENPQWESKDARGATLRSGVSETNQGGLGEDKVLVKDNVSRDDTLDVAKRERIAYEESHPLPEEGVGKVIGYCNNQAMMRLEVETVGGPRETSVWTSGYRLQVGEVLQVKVGERIGNDAIYEVVKRGENVEMEEQMKTNDGLTVAPVGFEGQEMRRLSAEDVARDIVAEEVQKEPRALADIIKEEMQKSFKEYGGAL